LVHIAPKERAAVIALADMLVSEDRAPEKEELELLRKDIEAVDIALFGRMLASSPKYNVEAAAQVAHAITVNRITVEDDYFTAVDDLNNNEEDAGSAHIGESGFGSGVFYTYICINKTLLIENLGSEDLASKSVKALTIAAATVAPSGKQNSYASRARALYIMAEKGSQQPRQLSSAFLKPVDNTDMANAAIERIEILRTNMDKVYGSCADDFKVLNVDKAEGSLAEILEFVGA
jgi:CRISPR system Cascade subunit CasC